MRRTGAVRKGEHSPFDRARETASVGDPVSQAYDAMAELYASLFLDDLDPQTVRSLGRFAAIAGEHSGPVADLGCGPGGVVNFLVDQGLTAFGTDLSPGQIEQARQAFPELSFDVGDMTATGFDRESLGGIVSKYSIIHLDPSSLSLIHI